MTQTPQTTRPAASAPAIVRIIGRNVADLAAILRDVEPEEYSRTDLLDLLGVVAASAELSGALLADVADRINAEARKAAR